VQDINVAVVQRDDDKVAPSFNLKHLLDLIQKIEKQSHFKNMTAQGIRYPGNKLGRKQRQLVDAQREAASIHARVKEAQDALPFDQKDADLRGQIKAAKTLAKSDAARDPEQPEYVPPEGEPVIKRDEPIVRMPRCCFLLPGSERSVLLLSNSRFVTTRSQLTSIWHRTPNASELITEALGLYSRPGQIAKLIVFKPSLTIWSNIKKSISNTKRTSNGSDRMLRGQRSGPGWRSACNGFVFIVFFVVCGGSLLMTD
jgi:hypothetical protein